VSVYLLICFFFLPDTDVSVTLLRLFVALVIPFSYEDKCLELTHPLTSGLQHSKHEYVMKADI